MTKGAFRIPVYGGNPDPATYCPANGYIPNPINKDWVLLAEFQTNSPNSTTFDPMLIASSGQFAWDLGDGAVAVGTKSIEYKYPDSTTKTVKLYGKGTCAITYFYLDADSILGTLDISNAAFSSLANLFLQTNSGLTSVVFPATFSVSMNQLYLYSIGISGVLDLSMITAFSSSGALRLDGNSAMTGVTFASSITGTMSLINIYSTGITGTLDLSKFTAFTSSASIHVAMNPSMTGVTFASSITGTFSTIYAYNSVITGTLDLSMFAAFTSSANISIDRNSAMTGVTFANSITGTMSLISIYSTGITGTFDLSKFTAYTSTATVYLNNNTSMTGVTFPASTITGFIRSLRLYSNTSLGYVNLTTLRTGVASLNWELQSNGWTAAIVNRILVDIDGISTSGFTGRVINIGGTNADPDSSSGGYDGTAARNSLISKGFTVTIT